MSAPMSQIYVCADVLIDSSYRHTIYFDSLTKQEQYFDARVVLPFTGYTYLRHTWSIKVAASHATARRWSYLFFINPGTIKRYYYFINRVEYINDETVELFLELDVIQTYLFDFSLCSCFIERETPASDEIGEHTIDEGLELGELECSLSTDFEDIKSLAVLIMATEFIPLGDDVASDSLGGSFNGIPYGTGIYVTTVERFQDVIETYEGAGKIDSIQSVWLFPKNLIELHEGVTWEGSDTSKPVTYHTFKGIKSIEYHINTPTSINGYTPKNNKLYCYPFNFLYVTNNLGTAANYKFERFSGNDKFFECIGSPFPDGGAKLIPRNYNGIGFNHDEGIALSSYPTCAYSGDYYKIWLAQNQYSRDASYLTPAITIAGGAIATVGSIASGNLLGAGAGVGAMVSGYSQIYSNVAREKDMKAQPDQARGNQSVSVNAVNGKQTFTFYYKNVTAERARIIDDFFKMYGYKVSRIGTPSLKNRARFTYVKTVDCLLKETQTTYTAIPHEDRRRICEVFNNGVTFWVDGDDIGNYTDDNVPLN